MVEAAETAVLKATGVQPEPAFCRERKSGGLLPGEILGRWNQELNKPFPGGTRRRASAGKVSPAARRTQNFGD